MQQLHSRSLWLAPLFVCLARIAAHGQTALVTFYSHGSSLTSGIPGTAHDIYNGSLFDGSQGLFWFRAGFFASNNHFLTLRLPPGRHTFGASNGKRPESRETLEVDLKPGEQYFIRAQGESKGVPGFTIQHGRLDLMSCAEAQRDLVNGKPLGKSVIWKQMRGQLASAIVEGTSPPPCRD